MSGKSLIWITMAVGSIIGGYIPLLWGSSLFSYASLLGNFFGGVLGLWLGFKISEQYS